MLLPSRGPRIDWATESRTEFPFLARCRIVPRPDPHCVHLRCAHISLSVSRADRPWSSVSSYLSFSLSLPHASPPCRIVFASGVRLPSVTLLRGCVYVCVSLSLSLSTFRVSACVPCVAGWRVNVRICFGNVTHVCPHLFSSSPLPPPTFFYVSLLSCAASTVTAYACVRGCVFGHQEFVLRWWSTTCVFRLPSTSTVHSETRGYVGTRLQIPASIMTPGSVNVRWVYDSSIIFAYRVHLFATGILGGRDSASRSPLAEIKLLSLKTYLWYLKTSCNWKFTSHAVWSVFRKVIA